MADQFSVGSVKGVSVLQAFKAHLLGEDNHKVYFYLIRGTLPLLLSPYRIIIVTWLTC